MSGISMRLFGRVNWNSDRHFLHPHRGLPAHYPISIATHQQRHHPLHRHTSPAYSTLCHVWNGLWLISALREERRDQSILADKMRVAFWSREEEEKDGTRGGKKKRRTAGWNNRLQETRRQMRRVLFTGKWRREMRRESPKKMWGSGSVIILETGLETTV